VLVDLPAAVAVRLRDDADEVVRASLTGDDPIVWRLAGTTELYETAQECDPPPRAAGLEVSVSKIVGDDALGDRRARVVVEAPAWSCSSPRRRRRRCWTTPPAGCFRSSRRLASAARAVEFQIGPTAA